MQTEVTLRQAIWSWQETEAKRQRARSEEHVSIEHALQEEAQRYDVLVERLRQLTTTCVVSDLSGAGELPLPSDAIEMLVQKGILYECDECEARADLDAVYGGDHREFHYDSSRGRNPKHSEYHSEYCAWKALHDFDPIRWTHSIAPVDEYDACDICGTRCGEKSSERGTALPQGKQERS